MQHTNHKISIHLPHFNSLKISSIMIFLILCFQNCSQNQLSSHSFASEDKNFNSDDINTNAELYPLQLFFKSGLSGFKSALTEMEMIASNFSMVEVGYPSGSSTPRTIDDLGPVDSIPNVAYGKLLYLIPITAIEEDQIVAGVTVSQINSDESAFVHSADPALLTFSEGPSGSLRVSWKRDKRNWGNRSYIVYKKDLNSSAYNKLLEIKDTGLNFYQFNDSWYNNKSTCYFIRVYSENTGKEHYYSHPRCTLTPSPFETNIVASHIYSLDENTFGIEFWANEKRSDYFVRAKIRKETCETNLNCFNNYSKAASFVVQYKDLYAYRTVITRAELVNSGFSALAKPLPIVTRHSPVYLNPIFEIGNQVEGVDYPTRSELITMNVNNRIRDRLWLGLYINPNSNTWVNYMTQYAIGAKKLGYSALFLDEVRPFRLNIYSPLGANIEAPSVEFGSTASFDAVNPSVSDPWGRALVTMINKLKTNFRNQSLSMSLIGNTLKAINPDETNSFGPPKVIQSRIDAISAALDGVMYENAFDNGTRVVTAEKWDNEILKIEEHLNGGRQVIAYATPDFQSDFLENNEKRMYLAACPHMISANPSKFFFGLHDIMSTNYTNNIFPEYRMPLGSARISRLWKGNYFYRLYDNGIVLINPSNKIVEIRASDLDYLNLTNFNNYWKASIQAASIANKNPGKLVCSQFSGTSLKLGPAKAVFLLNSNCSQ